MRRVALRAWVLFWLMLVWILLWGTVSAANIVSGLAIALVITVLLPLPPVPVEGRVHPLSLLRLIATVAYYLLLSSVQVAWLAIKPGPPPLTAVLRAHLAVKSDLVLALAVNIINLTPGSVVLEIDQARRMIYVHVIDVGSDRTVKRFYRQVSEMERLLVATFERDADWRPSADRGGDPHEHGVGHRRGDAGCGGRHHDVSDAGRTQHAGPARRAGHARRGDDVRDRHLGGVQPGHHGDVRPDRAGVDQVRRLGQCRAVPGARRRQTRAARRLAMNAFDIVTAVLMLSGSTLALTAAIGVVRFPDTLSRMHAATKPQVLGLLLVLAGAAIRLRGNVDVGMFILTGLFTLITAPVVGQPGRSAGLPGAEHPRRLADHGRNA